MLRREGAPPVGRAGLRGAGRRKGWAGLGTGAFVAYQTSGQGPRRKDLSIGKVLRNYPDGQNITIQPYKGIWRQLRVCHYPLYRAPDGTLTISATATAANETVRYSALVLQVELLVGGELNHGSARTLSDRG